jgi:hypothetical protein
MMLFMKIGLLLLLALLPIDPLKVATWNAQKRDGVRAFEAGLYAEAIAQFSKVVETGGGDAAVYLNLGHAHYLSGNMELAMQFYGITSQADNATLKSIGLHQLGVIYAKNKEIPKALQAFKEALKADPSNEPARINYELLKKKMDQENPDNQQQEQQNKEQQEQQQQQKEQQDKKDQDKQDNDQQQQDNSQQDSQQQEGEPKDPQQTDQKEQQVDEQQSKIEKERAQMILKDLEQQEKQFYQQLKRKTENKKTGKPDW